MSGKSLLSSLADKAQAAIAASPLAGKISLPGTTDDAVGGASTTDGAAGSARPSTDGGHQGQPHYVPASQEQSGTLGGRHYGLETLHHQLRSLQVQYSSGVSQENRQLQLLITAQKGVALDIDATGRDAKAQSKELYLWGQTQAPDIKDVTDRLAYINFVHGALSYTLATNVDKSRAIWKNVRDAEASLAPRRSARASIKAQINSLKTQGGRGGGVDTRLQDLNAQLKKAEDDDASLENELELLKRTAIRESETIKWKALQEYGHKLVLLSTASEQLIKVLPSSPPAQYTGQQQTAAVRAALQNALDSEYVPKSEHLPLNVGKDVGETRSFGETHASELSSITTMTDNGHDQHHDQSSAPINPAALNNAPATIPHYNPPVGGPPPAASAASVAAAEHGASSASAAHAAHYAPPSGAPPTSYAPPSGAAHYSPPGAAPPSAISAASPSSASVPHGPTVAETGVPLLAGVQGPGPATGNLADEARDRPAVGYGAGTNEQAPGYGGSVVERHESAEEEKRRLAAAYQQNSVPPPSTGSLDPHQGGLVASTSIRRTAPARPAHESAEDEKRRLEREERERVLRGNDEGHNTRQDSTDDDPSGGAAPPAYQS